MKLTPLWIAAGIASGLIILVIAACGGGDDTASSGAGTATGADSTAPSSTR